MSSAEVHQAWRLWQGRHAGRRRRRRVNRRLGLGSREETVGRADGTDGAAKSRMAVSLFGALEALGALGVLRGGLGNPRLSHGCAWLGLGHGVVLGESGC